MQTLMPWIAVAVTIVAGWALIKRYQTHMVLLFAGLVLLLCAAGLTDASFLPKGVKPSGFFLFDIFNPLKSITTKQSAGIGFLIMTAGGFAAYMDRIAPHARSSTSPSSRSACSRRRTSCSWAATSLARSS